MVIIPITGLLSKACLRISGGQVQGLEILHHALLEESRKGKGVLTRQKCSRALLVMAWTPHNLHVYSVESYICVGRFLYMPRFFLT